MITFSTKNRLYQQNSTFSTKPIAKSFIKKKGAEGPDMARLREGKPGKRRRAEKAEA